MAYRHGHLLALASIFLAAVACSMPGVAPDPASDQGVATLEALGTQVAQQTADAAPPADATDGPQTGDATAGTPTSTSPPPEPTATPTIVHSTIPSNPGAVDSFMTDRSTRLLASEKRAIGDNFNLLLLERPFTDQEMTYQGWLDIKRGEINSTAPWFYVTIFLEEGPPSDAEPYYGVEIDIDLDGRGDWLIWGQVPASSEWTTDGVRAFRDTNNDVGNADPILSDPPQAGDGYDELVFDAGHGPDPDAAWIRQSPSSSSQIEIAFKQTLIGPPGRFLWGVWADEGVIDPTWFDYNDHFTIKEAGSPVSTSADYPLKELNRVDNTCRWGYGFEPTGAEPGACYVPPTPTPTSPPPPTKEPTITPSPTVDLI